MTTTATGPGAGDTLEFGRGFTFFFEDPDWIKKALIGGLFTLLGTLIIGTIFVAGYLVRLFRAVVRGEARPLPEWEDLGGMFMDGLKAVAAYLIVFLIAMAVPLALGCVGALAGGGIAALGEHAEPLAALSALAFFGFYILAFVAALAAAVYFPAAFTRFVLQDRIGAVLEFRENVDYIRRNLANYALALVLYLAASFAAQFGFILCCVGLFATSFWAACVAGWALGEVARRDRGLAAARSRP
jgi:hypothetical protein